jgi:hypothetical protein
MDQDITTDRDARQLELRRVHSTPSMGRRDDFGRPRPRSTSRHNRARSIGQSPTMAAITDHDGTGASSSLSRGLVSPSSPTPNRSSTPSSLLPLPPALAHVHAPMRPVYPLPHIDTYHGRRSDNGRPPSPAGQGLFPANLNIPRPRRVSIETALAFFGYGRLGTRERREDVYIVWNVGFGFVQVSTDSLEGFAASEW